VFRLDAEDLAIELAKSIRNRGDTKRFEISPHPSPLPLGGEREGVRGANSKVKIVFVFVLT